MHIKTGSSEKSFILVVLFFGALWGLCEASLGFALHILSRFSGIPALGGFFMFPLGFLFMIAGVQASRRTEAALLIASAAALVKASSSLIGPVPWIFVQNPTISILFEGMIVWLLAGYFVQDRFMGKHLIPAFGAAFAWRIMFIAVHLVFGIRWGLLSRGTAAVLRFTVMDSLVNGFLIALICKVHLPEKLHIRMHNILRPAFAATIFIAAIASELIISAL